MSGSDGVDSTSAAGVRDYGAGMLPQHAALLSASAVPVELARARQYRSVDTKARLQELGFAPQQRRVPGLLIPLHDKDGKCTGFQYRPDNPRETAAGRVAKYESPKGQTNQIDVPPGVGAHLDDPSVPLWITEGARKADAAAGLGIACVSLSGVTGWCGTGPKGGRTALPDWQDVALNGRRVVLAFDSDFETNVQVQNALHRLAAYLRSKHASVAVLMLPPGADGKTGLDDYIAAGHGVDDLNALVSALPAPPEPAEQVCASPSTLLVQLAQRDYRLGMSSEDHVFALPRNGPRVVRALRGGKNSLRAALAETYFRERGEVVAQHALADAMLTLEGAAGQLDAERLYLRVAEHESLYYLDLGDATGRAVQLHPSGWRVVDTPPVLFRRTQLTGALPVPEPGGELSDLWRLLNVAERDRPLVLAWLVAALLPDVPHPVLAFRGEQGSGKSTATRTVAALLDPSPAQVRKPPRDVDGWVTAAAGSWLVGVDNVSDLRDWWSDALCRAVTGDGDVRRRLYSDADLAVFAFRRCVLLNGIDLGDLRDDLAERLLSVELHRIPDTGRKLDAALSRLWEQVHPRLLGAVLDLAVQVLRTVPTLTLDRLPRMADFARLLAAVDTVLGTDGLRRYADQAGDLAADAFEADPVLSAIAAHVVGQWEGTAGQLLAAINDQLGDKARPPKGWPKDARALTGLLRRKSPSLRRLGWVVEDLGRGGRDKAVRFSLMPPQDAGDSAGDSLQDAGDAGDMRATRNADARTAAGLSPAQTPLWGSDAGDAGVRAASSLTRPLERGVRDPENAFDVDRQTARSLHAFVSPASPVSPAQAGPCTRCGRVCHRYGDGGGPLCPACREGEPPPCECGATDGDHWDYCHLSDVGEVVA